MPDDGNNRISSDRVRYIKLGEKGKWEEECLTTGVVRLGFNTAEHFDLISSGQWDAYAQTYAAAGKTKGKVTEIVGQVSLFAEDAGSILWITFWRRKMWWCFIDPASPLAPHPDGSGTFRRTLDGWHSKALNGTELHMEDLSGHITQLAGYRGTCCDAKDPEYVVRRVNGEKLQEVEDAETLLADLEAVIIRMMRRLTPGDFELLVDLIFAASGWRRLGGVGGTAKLVDMELLLPTTGERAFVQVKSEAKQKEFNEEYAETFTQMSQFGRMFYAFHSGDVRCGDETITVLGPNRLASMVMDAGLASWLMRRI